jgi:hypothetical protein
MKNDTSRDGASITLDPRTEELLREIAADKESCLLRAPRRELEHALVRSDYRGVETTVGFSAAERELLRTARAEVAYWLNVVCFRRLTEDAATRRYFTTLTENGDERNSHSDAALLSGAESAIESARRTIPAEFDGLEILNVAVRSIGSDDDHPPVVELATASLRLQPSFHARHYAIQAHVHPVDARRRATRLASALAALCVNRRELAYAHSLRAMFLALGGDLGLALDSYSTASTLMPTHPEFRLRALFMAIRTGNRAAALRVLDSDGGANLRDAVLEAVRPSVSPAPSESTANAQELASDLGARVSTPMKRLLHELVEM